MAQADKDALRDQKWIWSFNEGFPNYGGTLLDFSKSPVEMRYHYCPFYFSETDASICDTAGNLKFFTNGVSLINYMQQSLNGAHLLNPGENPTILGQILIQGALILPELNNSHNYNIFHIRSMADTFPYGFVFYNSKINMDLNSGRGDTLYLNSHILTDTISLGGLKACRHANGRDWWILIPGTHNNKFYSYLYNTNGIHLNLLQAIGPLKTIPDNATFSSDGTKYISGQFQYIVGSKYADIYDFDRCTGTLSNPVRLTFTDTSFGGSIAVSPNSRYLYATFSSVIYQYDLSLGANIASSRMVVARNDGFTDSLFAPTGYFFYQSQVGPDNKLYISSGRGIKYFNIIDYPDRRGLACHFRQHVELPRFYNNSFPNFPNFRLGPLDGSGCDTLGLNQPHFAFLETDHYIDFDTLLIGRDSIKNVKIYNTGDGILNINSSRNNLSVYNYSPAVFQIQPGDSATVQIHFHPGARQPYIDTIRLFSNALASESRIFLRGVGDTLHRGIGVRYIPEEIKNHKLWVSPNPVGRFATLFFESPIPHAGSLHIIDMLGKIVDSYALQPATLSYTFPVYKLPAGTYQVIVEDSEGQLYGLSRFLKE